MILSPFPTRVGRQAGSVMGVAVFLVMSWVGSVSAQSDGVVALHRSDRTGRVNWVRIEPPASAVASSAQADPWAVLELHGHHFGVSDAAAQLVEERSRVDGLNITHSRFQQFHRGVRVFSGVLVVHEGPGTGQAVINGDFYPVSAKLSTTPDISESVAQQLALTQVERDAATVHSSELVIVDPGWYGDAPLGTRLAYYMEIVDPDAPLEEALFIDAHSGELLDRWSLIHTAKERVIYDGEEGLSLPGTLARVEGQGPTSDDDVDAAYDYYGDTYDYFFRGHGRDSVDGEGIPIVATVHSTSPGCPNAYWSGSLLQMVFCTGTVTDDIVGHELTHGVTQFSAGLIYQNQSGQLNESMSDIFGELIDLFNGNVAFIGPPSNIPWPTHSTGPGEDDATGFVRSTDCSVYPQYKDGVRWLMGEDADVFGGAIRDMWLPPCFGDPDQTDSGLQTCSSGDNGGVHSGSGIPNHAFAILTDGKTYNGYTIAGIGPIKAGAVWYRALSEYMTPATDFDEAYVLLNQAAADLVGTFPLDPRTGAASDSLFTADDAEQVDLALLAVEMNVPGNCGASDPVLNDAPAPFCPDAVEFYADGFESGDNGWTVANSAPLTPYDWVQTTGPLPFGRMGTAWFIDDPDLGDCNGVNESGTHSLFSPTVAIPMDGGVPMLAFDHYMLIEGGWDGGNVKVSVNGGAYQAISRSAFVFNAYNGRINSAVQGNDNPLKGEAGFTGAGGLWGTSIINLGGMAGAGDTVQVQFVFGKDGCTGTEGWYVDNFSMFMCSDCDGDAESDQGELNYTTASDVLVKIGLRTPQQYTLTGPPLAGGDVTLTLHAVADLAATDELINIKLNGVQAGALFTSNASDCPMTPDIQSLVVSAAAWNAAASTGTVVIDLISSTTVGDENCNGESIVAVDVAYRTVEADSDGDGLPDVCDTGSGCAGDANGDGVVDPLDSGFAQARFGCGVGSGDPLCDAADVNADGVVDPLDVGFVLARLGTCP